MHLLKGIISDDLVITHQKKDVTNNEPLQITNFEEKSANEIEDGTMGATTLNEHNNLRMINEEDEPIIVSMLESMLTKK